MVYRRNDGAVPGESAPDPSAGAGHSLHIGSRIAENGEKTEVAALLRLLTQLANCGLDAAAKPLLHTAKSGS